METNYFGIFLAELRRKNKLKQKQVAYEAGIDPSYVAALENGRRPPPRQNLVQKLANAVKADEWDEKELGRTAMLSQLARPLDENAEFFSGAPTALAILELSSVLSERELQAISTLIDSFRYRTYAQGRNKM